MRMRTLGRTGLPISEIAIGGGRVGGILIFPNEEIRAAALERAFAAGINWVDTAASYGDGESESTLGRWGKNFCISTKVQLKQEELADIPGAIERSLEKSLRRLQRDRVEVLQFHNHLGVGPRHVPVERMLGQKGVAQALARLKEQKLIAAMGMTAAGDTRACLEVINSGLFDTAQVYYNILNPSAAWARVPGIWSAQDFSGMLAACKQQRMGVFNIRVFAGGSLASATRHGREFVMAEGSDLDSEAHRAERLWTTLGDQFGAGAQTALRFCLGEARISTSVIGLAELAHLASALAAAELGPLSATALDRLGTLWAKDFN